MSVRSRPYQYLRGRIGGWVVGQWPSPELQLRRLIEAFEAVAADDSRSDEEQSRAAKIGLWLTGALQQVAIGALGGAGGNMLSG